MPPLNRGISHVQTCGQRFHGVEISHFPGDLFGWGGPGQRQFLEKRQMWVNISVLCATIIFFVSTDYSYSFEKLTGYIMALAKIYAGL